MFSNLWDVEYTTLALEYVNNFKAQIGYYADAVGVQSEFKASFVLGVAGAIVRE